MNTHDLILDRITNLNKQIKPMGLWVTLTTVQVQEQIEISDRIKALDSLLSTPSQHWKAVLESLEIGIQETKWAMKDGGSDVQEMEKQEGVSVL
jgi:hypothetical protein